LEGDRAVFDTPEGATAASLTLSGADRHAQIQGIDELPGKANYFPSGDARSWQTGIPTYARVKYPGIDLLYYGKQGLLEYDFVVAPGADPRKIVLKAEGADRVIEGPGGELVIQTRLGDIHFDAPAIYQAATDGSSQVIKGRYVTRRERQVGFEIASYDTGALDFPAVNAIQNFNAGRQRPLRSGS
jgi:hypothetical protein